MATCDSSIPKTPAVTAFIRHYGRLMLALPVLCATALPVSAQVWQGATNNGTAGEFNWTEVTNWSIGVPNAVGATATFGPASPGGIVILDSPITLGTLNFNSPAIYTIDGGANLLTMDAGGPAAINFNAGNVTVDADLSVIGGLNISVGPAAVLAEISGAIGGTGPISKSGTGTLVLSGVSTYSSVTNINAGTIELGVADALPDTSTVVIAGGAFLDLNNFNDTIGGLAGTGTVTMGSGNLTTGANGTDTTFSGTLTGTGALTKVGGGTFSLLGAKGHSGGTQIDAGVLEIDGASSLGAVAGGLRFNGGTLRALGSFTGAGSIEHDVNFLGNGTVDTGIFSVEMGGDFSGGGMLTKQGSGVLTLNGAMAAYGGDVLINDGFLEIATGGSDVLNGDISGTGTFVKSGPGVLLLNGNNNSHVGSTFVLEGRLRSGGNGFIGDTANVFLFNDIVGVDHAVLDLDNNNELLGGLNGESETLVVLDDATLTTVTDSGVNDAQFDGTITGNMASVVIKEGDGYWELRGNNTFEGELQINSGRVYLNDLDADMNVLANRNRVNIDTDGELLLHERLDDTTVYSDTIGPLEGNGDVRLGMGGLNSNTLTVNSEDAMGMGQDTLFSGRIIGDGGLTKVGSGTLTLGGANEYIGDTTINAGTLQLGADDRISDLSEVNIDQTAVTSAVLDLNGFNERIGSLRGNGLVTLGAGSLSTGLNSTADREFSGVISGTGGLTKEGTRVLLLSGMNTYTGATMVDGGTLRIGILNALADTTAVTVADGATLDLNDFDETIGSLSGGTMSSVTLGTATLTTGGDNTDTNFMGVISGMGGLVKEGTGTFILSGTNTYSGPTAINAGTLQLGAMDALPDTTAVTVAMGAIFDLNDFSDTIASLSGAGGVDLGMGTLTTGDANDTEFSGVISGDGGLVKEGTGTFTLSGVNTYSGGTDINDGILLINNDNNLGATGPGIGELGFDGGTLAFGADVTSARDVTLNAGGGTFDTNGFNATFSGMIDGAGGLTKEGLGTLTLTGMNSYMGGTTIENGVVAIGSDDNLGDPAGALTFNGGTLQTTAAMMSARDITLNAGGGTIDTNGFDSTFSGVISGVGDLTKDGAGVLTLSGANTYGGDTFINAGILRLGAMDVIPDTSTVNVAAGATFDLNSFDETIASLTGAAGSSVTLGAGILTTGDATPLVEYSGVISGTGGLTKQGTGIFRLSGMNTYTGPTTINAGTLQLGVDDALADTTAVTVGPAGTFDLNSFSDAVGSLAGTGSIMLGPGTLTTGGDNTSTTFGGVISGTGGLVKVGTGTQELTGVNTYSGGTAINGGALAVINDNNLGDPSGPLSFDGGILQTNAGIMSARSVTMNAGGGTIDTNGFDSVFSGVIDGPGALTKDGLGTLTLTGINTYAGGTAINGGVLSVGSDANLGAAAGPLSFDGGTLLTTAGITSARSVTINPGGGTIDTNGFDSVFSGAVTGTGGLTKDGMGVLTLEGPLAGYTGDTTINDGTLEIDTTGGSTTHAGDISGAGDLAKSGNNTLTLGGSLNGFTGDIAINAGTLDVNTTNGDTQIVGVISGPGNFTKSGANVLTLSGANTYTGLTTIAGGTLRLGASGVIPDVSPVTVAAGATFDLDGFDEVIASLAGAGNVTLGAGTLTTGGDNTSTEFSGVISGTGDVVKEGTGVFTLSGMNTYTGGTTINDGTVSVSSDSNLGDAAGPLTFDGGTLLTTAGITSGRTVMLNVGGGTIDTNGFDSIFTGVFNGVGALTKEGLGTLTLDGLNNYLGGTSINGGTVSIEQDRNLGDVASMLMFDGGTLLLRDDVDTARNVVLKAGGGSIDTNGFNSIFFGDISGPGGLTKEGAGTLSLEGANTYVGDTFVNAGRLDVNRFITSDTTVANGATLGGTGTVAGDVTVLDGGTLAPGNSIGRLDVVGTYTQSTGSAFELELRPAAPGTEMVGVDSDFTRVDGNAVIEPGATVNVVSQPGTYFLGSRYRFLETANGNVVGTYDNLNGAVFNNGLLTGDLFYTGDAVELRIVGSNFGNVATLQGKNAQSVALAIDQLAANNPTIDATNVVNQLLGMSTSAMLTAVTQIGGGSHGTNRLVAMQSSFDYIQAIQNRIRTDLTNDEPNGAHPLWVQAIGTFGKLESDENASGVDYDGSGVILGFDQGLESGRQGVSIGITQVDIDNMNGLDSGGLQNYNFAAYTSTIANPVYLIGVLGYAHNEFDATRQITALNPGRTANSSTVGNQLLGLLEYGLYSNTPTWDFQMFISGQYVGLHQDGFEEYGASSMNLGVSDNTTNSLRTIVGMRLAGQVSNWFEPEAHFGLIHEFLDPNGNMVATFNGTNISFSQCGVALPRNMGQIGAGGTIRLKDCISLYAGYDGMLSSEQNSHAVGGTLILNY